MNSTNPTNSTRKNIRETFGIINPKTMKLYEDIIDYSIMHCFFHQDKLFPDSYCINPINKVFYLIHMDSALRRKLKETGIVRVIVSLQKRTIGNFAEARVFEEKRQKKEGELK